MQDNSSARRVPRMKDNYVADIGDYGKYALLRHLTGQPGAQVRLGVVWYLTDHSEENNDGRHTKYLDDPGRFRPLDPELFGQLGEIIVSARDHAVDSEANPRTAGPTPRCVGEVKRRGFLGPDTLFAAEPVPGRGCAKKDRAEVRRAWWQRARAAVRGAGLVFLDPDNGLFPQGMSIDHNNADKSADPDEVASLLRAGQAVLLYHHLDRTKGGWDVRRAELIDAVRDSPGAAADRVSVVRISVLSSRGFLLFTPPGHPSANALHDAMASFAARAHEVPRFKRRVHLDERSAALNPAT